MSVRGAVAEILGSQTPTHRLAWPGDYSRGPEAIALAEIAGLKLDLYQKDLLVDGCMVTGDRWTCPEVGIELSRQNGKSVVFYARSLAGLFLFDSRLVVYSAHKGETAMEAFLIIEDLIMGTPELKREVLGRPSHTNGKEQIRLRTGQRIKFRTRTSGGGRGLSGDDVIIDESQDATDDDLAALLPTVLARPNSQLWYGGSAGTQKSTVQGRLVRRCMERSKGLVYYRFAASEDDDPADPKTWAKTNPALGTRILLEKVAMAQSSLPPDKFAQENLGIGDYPREEGEDWVIPASAVDAAVDPKSRMTGPVVFAFDIKPTRDWAAIAVAGRRPDGRRHVEVIDHERGTRWIVPRLRTLLDKNRHLGLLLDERSPAMALEGELRDAGIEYTTTNTADLARACGEIFDHFTASVRCPGDDRCKALRVRVPAIKALACPGHEHDVPQPEVFHRDGLPLRSAIAAAGVRPLGEAWAFRRHGNADISPLYAVTIANYGLSKLGRPVTPPAAPTAPTTTARSETADLATAGF